MDITVEISYYPLSENHQQQIEEFIIALNKNNAIKIEPLMMSSLLTGPYDDVMELLIREIKPFMAKYPSVFVFKVSNSCSACAKV